MTELAVREKRIISRKNLMSYVSIYELDTCEYVGLIVDLSQGGMLLTSVEALNPGKLYRFGLIDTLEPNAPDQIAFEGKARWCKKSSSVFYDAGFEFINLTNTAKEKFGCYE